MDTGPGPGVGPIAGREVGQKFAVYILLKTFCKDHLKEKTGLSDEFYTKIRIFAIFIYF